MASEVKTTKNSKLPKLSENYFEPVGKGGWPLISTWIIIDLYWYKLPNLSHSFLAESSPETFNNIESARQIRIILAVLSSFSHSFVDIPVDMVHGQTVVHCS
jgi:hypothetical protein